MIPVLRSIDSLLNRFDELSQHHAKLVSNFETNFTDIENPLHDVARDEDEQRKTMENLSKEDDIENDDQLGSGGTWEDFNRRNTKSRCQYRPPSYSSNESNSFLHRIPSRSSWATIESAPPPQTSIVKNYLQTTDRKNNFQRIASTSNENLIDPKPRFITKFKPNILPENPPSSRRHTHSPITTFTLQTAIRLSRPKTCPQFIEQKESPKRVHRRPRPSPVKKVDASESSMNSITLSANLLQNTSSKTKRTNTTKIRSSPKKLKAENNFETNNSKRIPISNYPRPAIHLAPPPTICLTFPMQPELKSSRVVVIPKPNPIAPISTTKTVNIFTNRRSLIPPKRLMYLMT